MGDRTKISVRTREGGADATVLTGMFGGGGHARASGATLGVPITDAIPQVLDAARQQLDARRG
jgi:nanoRNase/pAp phosphatase (c-di-AMP/oligoRNAs hydrolase)